jgi:hypothetical protein
MAESVSLDGTAKLAMDRETRMAIAMWRWAGTAILIAVAVVLPFTLSNYHVFELTQVMIYAIAVLGLNILTGYNGQISLGHGGFFAAGAYTAAILMHRYGVPYWATLPPAALVCFALRGSVSRACHLGDGGRHAAIAEIFRQLDRRQAGPRSGQADAAARTRH